MNLEYQINTYHQMLKQLAPYPFWVRYYAMSTAFEASDKEVQVTHSFHGGLYTKQMVAEADTLILGKVHKIAGLFILLSGTIFIDSEEFVGQITGPFIINSRQGIARWGYTVTDCVIANVFATSINDPAEFDKLFVEEPTW